MGKEFREIFDKLEPRKQTYLIVRALGGTHHDAHEDAGANAEIYNGWIAEDEWFAKGMELIKSGGSSKEALEIWVQRGMPKFLRELKRMALGKEVGERVKLDALKFCIGLGEIGGGVKVVEERTLLEKYVLDKGGELTVKKTISKEVQ